MKNHSTEKHSMKKHFTKKHRIACLILVAVLAITNINLGAGVVYADENIQSEKIKDEKIDENETEIAVVKEDNFEIESEASESEVSESKALEAKTPETEDEATEEAKTAEATIKEATTDETSINETSTDEASINETSIEETSTEETLIYEETQTNTEEASNLEVDIVDLSDSLYQAGAYSVTLDGDGSEYTSDGVISRKKYKSASTVEQALYEGLKNRAATINISSYKVNKTNIASILLAVINENPDLFYFEGKCKIASGVKTGNVTTVTPYYNTTDYDESSYAAFDTAVERALSVIDDGMSDLEKAIALHDYVILNCEYDKVNANKDTVPAAGYTAYGVLVENIAVCQGYALAYKYLCNLAGIECLMVGSDAMNHAWNLIKLDGEYYQVDTTWDDSSPHVQGRAMHSYMFMSDAEFKNNKNHHDWSVTVGSTEVDYTATDEKYDNYFWIKCNNQMALYDGSYYYVNTSGNLQKYNLSTGEQTTLVDTISKAWSYSGVYVIGDRLYYNTKDMIISTDFDGQNALREYALEATEGENIYNSFLNADGQIEFVVAVNSSYLGNEDNLRKISKLATPTISISEGSYYEDEDGVIVVNDRTAQVTISAEEGATVYYTTDGTTPTEENGVCYTEPFVVDTDMTIKARAVEEYYVNSEPASKEVILTYTVTYNNLEDAVNDEENPLFYTVKSPLTTLKPLSNREVYKFGGWYLDEEYTKAVTTLPTETAGDIVLYAKWEEISGGLWAKPIEDQDYTGTAITPQVRVYDGVKRLKQGSDYTVTYKNNIKAADADAQNAPTVYITGKGEYSGNPKVTFTIKPADITQTSADSVSIGYTGKAQKPDVTIYNKSQKLKNNSDYTLIYLKDGQEVASVTEEGTYQIKVTGKGNYTGVRYIDLTVTSTELISSATVSRIKNQTFTGAEITPDISVKYKGTALNLGSDYTVRYDNNTMSGTAAVIITGMGNYSGEKRVTFKITAIPMSKVDISGITYLAAYTGNEVEQENCVLTANLNGIEYTLAKDSDYTMTYKNNIKAGKATVTFIGKNGFTGKVSRTYTIGRVDLEEIPDDILIEGISAKDIIDNKATYTVAYTKGGAKPTPTITVNGEVLVNGTDYTLKYSKNTKISSGIALMQIKGKGTYSGTVSIPFDITIKDLSLAESNVTLTAPDKLYKNQNGNFKVTPKLVDSNGKALKAGVDYSTPVYTYAEDTVLSDGVTERKKGDKVEDNDKLMPNTEVTLSVTGIGDNYTGKIETTYRIVLNDIKSAKVSVVNKSYTGKPIELGADDINVVYGDNPLKLGEDFEIIQSTYANNIKSGTASVTIRGIGKNYGGTKTVKFKIKQSGMGILGIFG